MECCHICSTINIIMTRKVESNTIQCFSPNSIFLFAVCEYGFKCFAHDLVKRWDAYMNKYFEVSATYAIIFYWWNKVCMWMRSPWLVLCLVSFA